MSVLQWLSENWVMLLSLAYMLLNLVNGVLEMIPGKQGEEEGGWLSTVRHLLDKVSVLTSKNGSGTVKLPLTSSKTE